MAVASITERVVRIYDLATGKPVGPDLVQTNAVASEAAQMRPWAAEQIIPDRYLHGRYMDLALGGSISCWTRLLSADSSGSL